MLKKILTTAGVLCLAALVCLGGFTVASRYYTLNLDADKTAHPVPSTLYGIFFEDINYAGDGGLYPELIQNGSFEYRPDNPADYKIHEYAGFGWNFGGWNGLPEFHDEGGLNENNAVYISVAINGDFAFTNRGYALKDENPDIPINAGEIYDFSLYYRSGDFDGDLVVTVKDGEKNLTEPMDFSPVSLGTWSRQDLPITGIADGVGEFELSLAGSGRIDIDMISLKPRNTWGYGEAAWKNGGLRKDMVEALADLNPAFIRFPGGCIVEGHYAHAQAYNWKDSVGPLEQRKENPNLWGYMQSYGLGYHEYFQLCREMGAAPMPVIYAGMLCQGWDRAERAKYEANFSPGDDGLDRVAQDIIDLIEYANGSLDTKWGKKRSENGSPEPFGLEYLGIGNENFGEQYLDNFAYLREKVEAVYPDIIIVSSAGWSMTNDDYRHSMENLRQYHSDTIIDMHRYTSRKWLLNKGTKFFDEGNFERGVQVFMGEYAAHNRFATMGNKRPDQSRANTLELALAEAAFITGLERNSDVVVMSSYAPMFGKTDMSQWWPNLIHFSSRDVTLTPSYYVQKMFSDTLGTVMLDSEFKGLGRLFQSSSIDEEASKLYIKAVNPYGISKKLTVNLSGFELTESAVKGTMLTASNKHSTTASLWELEEAFDGGTLNVTIPPYAAVVYSVGIVV